MYRWKSLCVVPDVFAKAFLVACADDRVKVLRILSSRGDLFVGLGDTKHVSILLFFNTEENLRSWLLSDERAYWINEAKDEMLFETKNVDMHKGYARVARDGCTNKATRPLPPPKWKLYVYTLCNALCM